MMFLKSVLRRGMALFFALALILSAGAEELTVTSSFGRLPRAEYRGETYRMRSNLTTVLFIGTDMGEDYVVQGMQSGGQADFLRLVVIDHTDEVIYQLAIDRDTVTDVTVLGVFGNETGTRKLQISLSHAFGDGSSQSCYYTRKAVEGFLKGIEIDYYIAMDMASIGTLNDLLGGVTVKIVDDFGALDSRMRPGTTVTLTGAQAELFLRARREMKEGSNAARMVRQQTYITSAVEKLRENLKNDPNYAEDLLNGMGTLLDYNTSLMQLVSEANTAHSYEVRPAYNILGEHKTSLDGFHEFYADEDSLAQWILEAFFQPKK